MNGGNLLPQYHSICRFSHNSTFAFDYISRIDDEDPTYLLKTVQGFQSKGIPIYAISIQVRGLLRDSEIVNYIDNRRTSHRIVTRLIPHAQSHRMSKLC